MQRKIRILFCTLFVVVLMTSCGSVSKMNKELDEISINIAFDEPQTGFTSVDEIGEVVYEQQMMLCKAYCETYEKTSYGLYENRFADVTKSKVMSELNNTRTRLNNECTEAFAQNLMLVLNDVTDCQNKKTYITKRRNEVLEFYLDYRDFVLAKGNVAEKRIAMLLKYFEKNNSFALEFLKKNKDDFISAGVEVVEQNAEKTDNLRSYVTENNKIIKALNELYGGTSRDIAKKVNTANRKLAERILDTMGELTEEEKEAILKEIDGDYKKDDK